MIVKNIWRNPSYNVLNCLFIAILLNLIPVFFLGVFDIARPIYTVLVGLMYILQSVIFLLLCISKIRLVTRNELVFLGACSFNCILSMFFVFLKFKTVGFNDMIFSLSVIYNVLIYIICIKKFTVSKDEITEFFKKMVLLGLFSVVINVILNVKYLPSLFTVDNSYNLQLGSFFPNRNQFGLFMLIMIISNTILYKYKSKKELVYVQIIFLINLILTMSRTSMLGLFVFFIVLIYYKFFVEKKEISKKVKRNIIIALIVIMLITIILFLTTDLFDTLNTLFLRMDTIKTGSGRFELWSNSVSIVKDNNLLFGVGRFKGLELNRLIYNSRLDQFHSIYFEKLFTHGIMGIIWLMTLFCLVWKQITRIEGNIKSIIKASFVTFLVISLFETTTRFSMGYADTISMLFFISIPLVLSNQGYRK